MEELGSVDKGGVCPWAPVNERSPLPRPGRWEAWVAAKELLSGS
jgi:hypothetical protein